MRIVDEIYESLTDDDGFAALVDGRACTLQAFSRDGDLQFLTYNYYTPAMEAKYMAEALYDYDPWREPFGRPEALNKATLSQDVISGDAYLRSEFYNRYYRPFGDDTGHCIGTVMPHRDGTVVWGIHRAITANPFSRNDQTVMASLMPHMRRALVVRAMVLSARSPLVDPRDVLDGLTQAILVVDHTGRLLFANRQGERLIAAGGPLMTRLGKLQAREPRTDHQLASLITAATLGKAGRGGAMPLNLDDRRSVRVVVAPWRADARTRAILIIDTPDGHDGSLAAKLTGLYGFTATEAETIAALAEGLSPTEVADARGVSVNTVRTQIQQALRKADVRSLMDLVRLAASLPRLDERPN